MGVYIKGMEMPTGDEMLCINIFPDGKVTSHFDLRCMPVAKAVPVSPHGRLGDLNELHKEAVRRSEKAGTYGSWYNCTDRVISAFDIEVAPTIIPADPATDGE